MLFLPLRGRTPSCPVFQNFIIISLRACSDIGLRRCFLRRQNSITAVAAFSSLRQYSFTSNSLSDNEDILQCSSDCDTKKKYLPFIVHDICVCYCNTLPHSAFQQRFFKLFFFFFFFFFFEKSRAHPPEILLSRNFFFQTSRTASGAL